MTTPAHRLPGDDLASVLPPALAALAQSEAVELRSPGRHAAAISRVEAPRPTAAPRHLASSPDVAAPAPTADRPAEQVSASVAQLLAMLPETAGAPHLLAAQDAEDAEDAAEAEAPSAPAATDGPGRRARGRRASGRRAEQAAQGPLAGSVLSPQTWRQAVGAVGRRAS